jgi:hypothetical protein
VSYFDKKRWGVSTLWWNKSGTSWKFILEKHIKDFWLIWHMFWGNGWSRKIGEQIYIYILGSYSIFSLLLVFFKFKCTISQKIKDFLRNSLYSSKKTIHKKITHTHTHTHTFDWILCYIHLSIKYTPILSHKYILWCIWWVHLLHFGNCVKSCILPTYRSPLWIGF